MERWGGVVDSLQKDILDPPDDSKFAFPDPDNPDFGACCACGEQGPSVRNLILLPLRALQPANRSSGEGGLGGWGCAVCHLPCEGAVAALCDRCAEEDRPLAHACVGYPALGVRVPVGELTEPFEHDPLFHPELRLAGSVYSAGREGLRRDSSVPNTLFDIAPGGGPGHGDS